MTFHNEEQDFNLSIEHSNANIPLADKPFNCFGQDQIFMSPIENLDEQISLVDFPLSVPNLVEINDESYVWAQIFEDFENHCDVIGFSKLSSLPSEDIHPFTPVTITNLPLLGESDHQFGYFPPADPTFIFMEDKNIGILLFTLKLDDNPREGCIGMGLTQTPEHPELGFTFLENVLWCEPEINLMDASASYDSELQRFKIFISDFSQQNVVNYMVQFSTIGDPNSWMLESSQILSFTDFHLLGNFTNENIFCDSDEKTYFGTADEGGSVACFHSQTNSFTTDIHEWFPNIVDPTVGFDHNLDETVIIYSLFHHAF